MGGKTRNSAALFDGGYPVLFLKSDTIRVCGIIVFTFMAQRSVTTQTTLSAESQPITLHYRWMRFFFAENTSAASQPIVALQQRAVWISIALLLQALNEIDHAVYFPFIAPFGSL